MRELERDLPITPATPKADPASVAIVGAGRVGRSIAAALGAGGAEVRLVGHDELGEGLAGAGAALLCVPDDAIVATARSLAGAGDVPGFVGHTSGAGELGLLDAVSEAGARRFSLHPLQTVPDAATDLSGCPCAISGSDGRALEYARTLAERAAMRPFEVDEGSRATYHAAASLASNLLVALEESAAELLGRAGVDEPRGLLTPLVLRTASNWAALGPAALTGPIARGDSETVDRHREALRERAPELVELYDELAERAAAIAARRVPTGVERR